MPVNLKKLSEHPPWVALSRDRDHIPSFPRKRESSGWGLNTRDGTQRFQTASKRKNPFYVIACCLSLSLGVCLSRRLHPRPNRSTPRRQR